VAESPVPPEPKGGRRAFLMRVRPDVLAAVERLAAAELRSVNAQVEMLLREALARRGALRPLDSGPASEEPPSP
jgi:hypothetical protein